MKVRTPRTLDSAPAESQLTPSTRRRKGAAAGLEQGCYLEVGVLGEKYHILLSLLQWGGLTVACRRLPPVFIPLRGLDTDLFRSVCLFEGRHVTLPSFQNM